MNVLSNVTQAIILEGKYWKRKWKVITAEYKKWRRYNVTRALGTSNILDTVSFYIREQHTWSKFYCFVER